MPCGHRIDPENIKNHLLPILSEVKKNTESLTPDSFSSFGIFSTIDDKDDI
jgi:hypothetical protein